MTMKLNRSGYEKLVEGDLEWLQAQPSTLESRHIAEVLQWSIDALYKEDALKIAVQALIETLPKCTDDSGCTTPATRTHGQDHDAFCDMHGGRLPEYPRAAPLRTLIELMKEGSRR